MNYKYFVLIFATLLSLNSFAQSILYKTNTATEAIEYYKSEKSKIEAFTANKNTNETKSLHKTSASNPLVIYSDYEKYTNSYDVNGNLTNELIEKKDGGVFVNFARYSRVFNSNNLIQSELKETWNGSAWVNSQRVTNEYTASFKVSKHTVEDWINSSWKKAEVTTFGYDNTGKMGSKIVETFSVGLSFSTKRMFYNYDAQNNLILYTTENYNYITGAFVNETRTTMSYTATKRLLLQTEEVWTNNTWVFSHKIVNEYDGNSFCTSTLQQTYQGNSWVNNTRSLFTRSGDFTSTTEVFQNWAATNWENVTRTTSTTVASNNTFIVTMEGWIGTGYMNFSRTITTTNQQEQIIKFESLNFENNFWNTDYYITYTYGNNSELTRVEGKHNNSGVYGPHVSDYAISFVDLQKSYVVHGSYVNITYIGTDVKDASVSEVSGYNLSQNYPNPFNPSTVISFSLPYESNVTLKVYNAVGELVKVITEETKGTGKHSVNFNAANLTSGIYFYQITATPTNGKQGFTQTKKMLLVK